MPCARSDVPFIILYITVIFFFWIFILKERIYIYMFGFYPHVRCFPFGWWDEKQAKLFQLKKKRVCGFGWQLCWARPGTRSVATTTAVNREQVFSCVFLSCVVVCVILFFTCVCVCVCLLVPPRPRWCPVCKFYLVFGSVVVAIWGLTSVFFWLLYLPSASFVPWLVDSTTSVGQIKKKTWFGTTFVLEKAGHTTWTFIFRGNFLSFSDE